MNLEVSVATKSADMQLTKEQTYLLAPLTSLLEAHFKEEIICQKDMAQGVTQGYVNPPQAK